ncbi:MAG: EAL domain-containing protein [Devosiaceae bacterium]
MQMINRTLARLRDHLGMDIAYISQLEGEEMIIRAHCAPNLPTELPEQFSLPREAGFCHHLVNGDIPSILHDSSKHPIAANLPTRHEFGIEAYIGLPLQREDGSNYGTLCCLSHVPNNTLNDRDLETVKLFAELVVEQIDNELEDRRLADDRQKRIQAVLDEGLLRANFQPIISLADGSLNGFEALARFNTDRYCPPDTWFAEAANIGRGVELELEALSQALDGQNKLPTSCVLGVNVSPECLLSEGLSDLLMTRAPTQIVLEVTEHAQVHDYGALVSHIERYKKAGYRIAVDDAGAGYSSLSHIVQLQPDIIKLDMSLTRNVNCDQVRRSLANALVFFAKETNAEIVAEGIETVGEKNTLTDLGVDFGQGYFFERPMELEDAITFATDGQQHKNAA